MAHSHVLRRTKKMPFRYRIPRQTKAAKNELNAIPILRRTHAPFPRLPYQPNIWLHRTSAIGIAAVLRPVPHEHLPRDGARRDEVGVLRHVPRAVDLARVVDALRDLYARLGREGVPASSPRSSS